MMREKEVQKRQCAIYGELPANITQPKRKFALCWKAFMVKTA